MGTGTPTATETAVWMASTLGDGSDVRPLRSRRRAHAELQVLEITTPSAPDRRVLAKCARSTGDPTRGTRAGGTSRPALVPKVPSDQHFALESAAAERLHDLLTDLDGVRAPGVVTTRTDPPTLVLELLEPATPLSTLLLRVALVPGRSRRRRAIDACAAAGHGVRRLTSAGPLADRPTRQASPQDLLATAGEIAAFLETTAAGLSTTALDQAKDLLDGLETWPVAAGHGDFAPRNVLVLTDGIAVIDALFAHNVPVVEDPARFVVNTLASLAEVPVSVRGTDGLARDAVEAFVDGCGHTVDDPAFRAMCVVVALDRWAAIAARSGGHLRGKVRTAAGSRTMPLVLRRLLDPA